MCMTLVGETSVVMYMYGLGGRDVGGHVCVYMALVAETSAVMYV